MRKEGSSFLEEVTQKLSQAQVLSGSKSIEEPSDVIA